MKAIAQSIYSNPKYSKLFEWGKLISITGGAQTIVQGLGFICGILIIRLLPTQEYALYTLANTFLGLMTMLADSGISGGVMAEGGKVWQDKKQLGVVLSTGLSLRRRFGIYTLAVTTPVMAYLFVEHGASWFTTILIILSLIPAFFASLSDTFLEMAPKLHQEIKPLQKNNVEVGVGRLVLSFLFLFLFPYVFVAILASSIPRIYGNYKLEKISAKFASTTEQPNPLIQKEVIKGVKRTLPIVIYHCISGQITIWLVSFFGSTTNLSEIGALGRLSVIFGLISSLFTTLIVPRFSRMKASKPRLMKTFLFIQAGTFLISIFLLVLIWAFSDQMLWILGKNYKYLNYELLLMATQGCIGLMAGVCSSMVISRGWFIRPYFLIGINFISTVITLAFFDITSLIGVLYFTIALSILAYLLVFFYGLWSIYRTPTLQT